MKRKVTFHVESVQQVENLITHLNNGYVILSGPDEIRKNGKVLVGEHKGYSFGLYRLEQK